MITTARLELVPATAELLRAALEGQDAMALALRAAVPPSWPPESLDDAALEFVLAKVAEDPEVAPWWMYFVLLPGGGSTQRALIGTAGSKGPPSADGTVEVGYGIATEFRRQGYASEATLALVAQAFRNPAVTRVIAETLPSLAPSIGVLRKCGFRFIGDGSEPGAISYELTRSEYARGPMTPA